MSEQTTPETPKAKTLAEQLQEQIDAQEVIKSDAEKVKAAANTEIAKLKSILDNLNNPEELAKMLLAKTAGEVATPASEGKKTVAKPEGRFAGKEIREDAKATLLSCYGSDFKQTSDIMPKFNAKWKPKHGWEASKPQVGDFIRLLAKEGKLEHNGEEQKNKSAYRKKK